MPRKFKKLCADLETRELRSEPGLVSPSEYAQLLAVYLYNNQISHAKLFYKRIPDNIKSNSEEIDTIQHILQELIRLHFPEVFNIIDTYSWSEEVAVIIRALTRKIRRRSLKVIARSYSSISINALMAMTGLNQRAVYKVCRDKKWLINANGCCVIPDPPVQSEPSRIKRRKKSSRADESVSLYST